MLTRHNPPSIAAPVSKYAHGVEVPAGLRTLHVSGQVPVRPDGTIPTEFPAQYEQVWSNIRAILASAGMGLEDIAKMTTYLTRAQDIASARDTRDKIMGGVRVASTLVVVAGLANPAFLVEIEVTAAK